MTDLMEVAEGTRCLLMGNAAIARGALEAGVSVAAGYPGTPSSEIIENLSRVADRAGLHVRWAVNEKVAAEVAAAASFAGLRSICTMKQNGMHVASDFLLHLTGTGVRAGMAVIVCEDPGALSSQNEADARFFARMLEVPLLEPGDFQEAKDMTRWALELSEELKTFVILRSVTRMSHASGTVTLGALSGNGKKAYFECTGSLLDFQRGPMITGPGAVTYARTVQQGRLRQASRMFDQSPFNSYTGSLEPRLLVVSSSACALYAREAIEILGAWDRVGLLKLGTTWPLPEQLVLRHLAGAGEVLVVEEPQDFLEDAVKVLAAEQASIAGAKVFYGKRSGHVPPAGELNCDVVIGALARILGVNYEPAPKDYADRALAATFTAPGRELTFCAGCPHRASFYCLHNALALKGKNGFVCGDVGCYTMGILPAGFEVVKTAFCMGSGIGLASGFGKLGAFGFDQPVVAVCGDSTFFHAAMPALVDAVHHEADVMLVVLDNSGTAMTGFQPHPGIGEDASGKRARPMDIEAICRAMGAKVVVCDPFEVEGTERTLLSMLEESGPRVAILRQECALSPHKRAGKRFKIRVDEAACIGSRCGCNRMCTRVFRCPGLFWDARAKVARIDEVICTGCGVCASVCPSGAIRKEEAG
ncbi:MAG TPA: thiamine pyrophosphate-dependent enzyme [Deltaproteobacteria bacterium]|nr:thiamine pyrophosphate-dependent enzyme [Deltaproteobacteria bacterium]